MKTWNSFNSYSIPLFFHSIPSNILDKGYDFDKDLKNNEIEHKFVRSRMYSTYDTRNEVRNLTRPVFVGLGIYMKRQVKVTYIPYCIQAYNVINIGV